MPSILVDTLAGAFDSATVARGREIFARGDVVSCSAVALGGARALSGEVRDGAAPPRQVYVMLEGERISGDCTCPLGADCEHVVALVLADERVAPATVSGRDKPHRPVLTVSNPCAPASGGARMVYLLDQTQDALFVCPARASSGDTLTPYAPHRAVQSRQPAYVTDEDLTILRRLAAGLKGTVRWVPLPPGYGDLLADMIATGRCYWKNLPGLLLHAGEPLTAVVRWRLLDNGDQRLVFDIPALDGFQWLPVHPPFLLDPESGRCVGLRCPTDTGLAVELMNAPDLSPSDVPRVIRDIDAACADPAFPRPRQLELRQARVDRPSPRLVLEQLRLTLDGKLRSLPAARLSFDYDGAVFGWSSPYSTTITGDFVSEVRRDVEYESRCTNLLAQHDLIPAQSCFDPAALRGSGGSGLWVARHPLAATGAWVGLQRDLPQLRAEGWHVRVDPAFAVRLVQPDGWYGDLISADNDGFELDFGIELDSQRFSLLAGWLEWVDAVSSERMHAMLVGAEDMGVLVLPVGECRVVVMPPEHLRAVLRALGGLVAELRGRGAGMPLPRARLGEVAELGRHWTLQGGSELVGLAQKLSNFRDIEKVPPPRRLRARLRPYQQAGLDWLQFLREYGFGGVLADDMGLGKTVQTLAHVLVEQQAGRLDRPALVVAPTSLMFNWRAEARRFAPDLSVLTLHGPDRKLRFHEIPDYHLVLTTYPLIPRDLEQLQAHRYHLLILDEAQVIKNPAAKLGRLIRRLHARHRLCLTGTPMENHLGELWSLFDFLMPGLLGGRQQFRRDFQTPIERHDDEQARDLLTRRIRPFMLRRTKQAVAPELPPKSEIMRTVALCPAQFRLYETMRVAMLDKVRRALEQQGAEKSRIIVLDALLKLRQICCDPRLVTDIEAGAAGSAKLELLLRMLPELLAEGRRVLLFSQFVGMLNLIVPELKKRHIAHALLTGRTRDRARVVDHFQQGRVPLFLISLKAGGVGLNLTAADTVIHYDPWWNPAAEDQATDRAHRIGQRQKVFVYRLLTENTVEDRVHELQQRKRGLIEAVMGGGDPRALDARDLELLFQPPG